MIVTDKGNYPGEEPTQQIADWSYVPCYHIYPPYGGYLNDVNAFFKYKGRYHLFFQYAKNANDTGEKVWMHFSGTDLVNWEYHGTPLTCDSPFDSGGVWSGSAFFKEDGTPVITYYAYASGICFAYPEDPKDEMLVKWRKHPGNPVIPAHKSGDSHVIYDVSNVFRHDGRYCLISGNHDPLTGKPTSFLYTSDNLEDWRCEGRFIDPVGLDDKDDMACPAISRLKNGLMLYTFSSHYSGVRWYTGSIEGGRFNILNSGKFNYPGGNEMGQNLLEDGDGLIYKSWLTVRLADEELLQRGWSGVLTLPKEIDCDEGGNLKIAPLSQVFDCFDRVYSGEISLDGSEQTLPVRGRSFALKARVCGSGVFGVRVGVSKDEHTDIAVDFGEGRLVLDFEKSTALGQVCNKYMFEFRDYEYLSRMECDVPGVKGGECDIAVFFDKCVIEVFVDGKSLGKTVRPSVSADGIAVFSENGSVRGELQVLFPKVKNR